MRVQNGTAHPPTVVADSSQAEATGTPATSSSTQQTSTLAPSSEWLALLNAVQQQPEVRPDVVAAAANRLASGELLTSAASARTAEAILAVSAGTAIDSPPTKGSSEAGGTKPVPSA